MSKKREIAIKQLQKLDKLSPKEMRLAAQWDADWKVLLSTILSAQTKDETTIAVCEVLFEKYPTIVAISKVRLTTLEKLIRPVNYHKTKAKHFLATAKSIVKDHNAKVPNDIEILLTFPGVGRKVANVYLAEHEKKEAIGVDTHVARIAQKLGWSKNNHPHKIEKDLEKLFPKNTWRSVNDICVRFGRSHSKKQEDEIFVSIKKIT